MAQAFWLIIAASVLMGYSINSAEAFKEEAGVIHVGGRVLCQDCTEGWNEWVHGAKPIKGCRVSITCMDDRKRVMHYGSDETDEAGGFEMTLNKSINGKTVDPKKCLVRLVSSPDPVCNIATDFAGGRSGVNLRRPNVVYRGLVKHELPTFYYTTPMCDEPNISDSNVNQNKY
ncbi:pistil-specific extensin-like protein [Actinidia eriantha]|uniref:pistil-specific extensin-like protein n=1 Tax=Actinidia eriantha TaxID=165200 RepID=UPI002586DBFA|nr:pistil-specific extensin-like protein [Actinidia eriantha]